LCIVGFSLGGSIALKLAGEWAAISAPTDLSQHLPE